VPGPVWTGAENLAPTGIRSPDRRARSVVVISTELSWPTLSINLSTNSKSGTWRTSCGWLSACSMHANRQTDGTYLSLSRSCLMIRFGDKTKVKSVDIEGLMFPLVSIQKVTIISATQLQDWCCLTACAYFRRHLSMTD
jgi:hypothetical protein